MHWGLSLKLIYSFLLFTIILICPILLQAGTASPEIIHPFRIAGNLYYVGNNYAATYLIVTSKGNILINSDFQRDVPTIKANIEKLGFKYNDIKVLLIGHAHADHCGGSALIKVETGAKYMVMDADVSAVESGGKTDFQYGSSKDLDNFYSPTKVDRILHDGDQVKLGDTVLVAHLTAGHTKGCTTWTMNVTEKGKLYHVVIVGGPYVNPGYKLVYNTSYPKIANDYEHTFKVLKSMPCDIFLGAHGLYFDLEKKYALINTRTKNQFIDPEGYRKFILLKEQDFQREFARQKLS